MPIRCVIVDDESLARERLRVLLKNHPDIVVIAEAADGASAVEVIEALKPDLVFLDVQMPELDGFGVVESLSLQPLPRIIFVTAHEKFALKAFDVHAVDYLLKPFDRSRFDTALQRALDSIQKAMPNQAVEAVETIGKMRPLDRLAVKADGKVRLLRFEEIEWIEAADNYVTLHLGTDKILHRETLNKMEARVPASRFMRISRSCIINVEKIKELQPLFHGEYVVILRGGARVTLSRSYRDKLNELLGHVS